MLPYPTAQIRAGALGIRDQCRDEHMNLIADVAELNAVMPEDAAPAIPQPGLVIGVDGLRILAPSEDVAEAMVGLGEDPQSTAAAPALGALLDGAGMANARPCAVKMSRHNRVLWEGPQRRYLSSSSAFHCGDLSELQRLVVVGASAVSEGHARRSVDRGHDEGYVAATGGLELVRPEALCSDLALPRELHLRHWDKTLVQ